VEEKGIAMLLLTPDRIRTLQRKLYIKAKQDRSIVFTHFTTSCIKQIYSIMLGGWLRLIKAVPVLMG
jgi:hypothetical protein